MATFMAPPIAADDRAIGHFTGANVSVKSPGSDRLINTDYQASSTARIVMIATAIGTNQALFKMGSASSPSTIVARANQGNDTNMTVIVPPNWFYRFEIVAGTPSNWVEVNL